MTERVIAESCGEMSGSSLSLIPRRGASHAQLFFDKIVKNPAQAFQWLEDLVSEGADENQWRDFKEAGFIDAPLPLPDAEGGKARREEERRRDDDVKRTWSENLSAFANAGGGLLIWGIHAPKRRAEKPSLTTDAAKLADRLSELQNNAVDPPIVGVELCAVTRPSAKEGFVVCLIPDSSHLPHRALWAEREYYMRVGDSNLSVPTAILRRMFYPQSTPCLIPKVKARLTIAKREPGAATSFLHVRDDLYHLELSTSLHNCGTASASGVCVEMTADVGCKLQLGPLQSTDWSVTGGARNRYDCRIAIHPGQTVEHISYMTSPQGFDAPSDGAEFRIAFNLFAHHSPQMVAAVVFTGAELKLALENWVCKDATPAAAHF